MILLRKKKRGQSMLEYVILIGVVVMVFFAMNPLIKRGLQGMIKTVADQVGTQEGAEQKVSDRGYMVSSEQSGAMSSKKGQRDFLGNVTYDMQDTSSSTTTTFTNLGFTNTM